MSNPDQGLDLRLEIRIAASPETVFGLLTDPIQMKMWLAEIVEAEARPGGRFLISGPSGLTIEGTYVEAIPHKKVMFTWGGVEGLKPGQSTVEFLLEPDGAGTLVRLRHFGLPASAVEPHRRGRTYSGLVKLKDIAEGRRPARLCLSDIAEQGGSL
jgi:uncharacterized protein YndB with AHSA1/START domain